MARRMNWDHARRRDLVAKRGGDPVEPSKPKPKPPKPQKGQGMTSAEIEAAKSPAGGYTRASLAALGVPWPPPKGWKKKLERGQPITPK